MSVECEDCRKLIVQLDEANTRIRNYITDCDFEKKRANKYESLLWETIKAAEKAIGDKITHFRTCERGE